MYPTSPTAGSTKIVFTYDYMGRRIRRQDYTWNGSSWPGTFGDRKFVFDGWNTVLVMDTSNVVLRQHIWGLDLGGQRGNNLGGTGISLVGLHGVGGMPPIRPDESKSRLRRSRIASHFNALSIRNTPAVAATTDSYRP